MIQTSHKVCLLAVVFAFLILSSSVPSLAKEQRYTFSCEGMHGTWHKSTVRVTIKKPLLGKSKANVELMTKENRAYFEEAVVRNFDDDFVFFTDGWGYTNENGYDMCKSGWQQRCLIAKTLVLKADKSSGQYKHQYHKSHWRDCCNKGIEKNRGDSIASGTCTRLVSE